MNVTRAAKFLNRQVMQFDVSQDEGRLDLLVTLRTLGVVPFRLDLDAVKVERFRRRFGRRVCVVHGVIVVRADGIIIVRTNDVIFVNVVVVEE